jgi:D-lyxose ketol-isomerase
MDDSIPGYTIAGAIVRKPYGQGAQRVLAGTVLSTAAYAAIKYTIKRLWLRDGQITPFYVPRHASNERHVIHRGGGRYDVVHGTVLNAEPLSREAAEALAQTKAT